VHRIGLVGVGKMGVSHLAIGRAHPRLDCVAVCDSQPFVLAAVRSQLGLDTYRSLDAMIAGANLDGVIVSTPTSSHVPLAELAIANGLGVFVEKPLALRAADSRALAALADARGVANQVGYHNRFIGTFRETRRLVEAGAIGRVHHVEGQAFGPVVTKAQGAVRTWRAKRSEGGGCLHDYACHVIDLMNFVVGPPETVVGARLGKVHSADVDDSVYAILEYGSGTVGTVETNWSDESHRKMTTSITVHGSHGKISADRQECRLYLEPRRTFEKYESGWTVRYITELQEPVDYYLRGEEYTAQLDAFADALAGSPREQACTFADAAETDRVVEEIIARDRQRSSVPADAVGPRTDVPSWDEVWGTVKRYATVKGENGSRRLRELQHKWRTRRA
jgi:predicted dehydrogenase